MNIDEIITEITQDNFDIETLETRNSDELDFHNISVWNLKQALKDAFDAGRNFPEIANAE